MYGTNPVAKARKTDFRVHSIFYTIQGEGPYAGLPAIFVRFAGCNLRCTWCDTEFDEPVGLVGGGFYTAPQLAKVLEQMRRVRNCSLFVLTGGEPMLQPLPQLIWAMEPFSDILFQIETAGTVWPEDMEDCLNGFEDPEIDHSAHIEHVSIVCSPKTAHVHALIAKYADAWKYIVRAGETSSADGLPATRTQLGGDKNFLNDHHIYRPWRTESTSGRSLPERDDFDVQKIFIQPMDEAGIHQGRKNIEAAADIVMLFGYRLSLQLHKIVGLD